jgi:hypothetical protein
LVNPNVLKKLRKLVLPALAIATLAVSSGTIQTKPALAYNYWEHPFLNTGWWTYYNWSQQTGDANCRVAMQNNISNAVAQGASKINGYPISSIGWVWWHKNTTTCIFNS